MRHHKQKRPGGLSQSACVSYSDVEAGFAKDIIPAGDNILRAAFDNFHNGRQGSLWYLGIVVSKQCAASFRNPYLCGIGIRGSFCYMNVYRLKRVPLIRPKENNITEQAEQTRHSQSRLPENSALRGGQPI